MAYNAVARVQPISTSTVPKEDVNDSTLTGATATLVDVSGEYAWNTDGEMKVTIPTLSWDSGVAGSGVSFAIRFRVNAFGSDTSANIAGSQDAGIVDQAILRKGAASLLTFEFANRTISLSSPINPAIGEIYTAVVVAKMVTSEGIYLWRNKVGRVSDAHDSSSVGFTRTGSIDEVVLSNGGTGADIDVFDIIVDDGELTDNEAATAADDVRTAYPVDDPTLWGLTRAEIEASDQTGGANPPFLVHDFDVGDLSTDRFRAEIVTPPSAGTWTDYPDSRATLEGAPDGTYTATYERFKNNVSYGTSDITLNVGVVPSDDGMIKPMLKSMISNSITSMIKA